MVMVMVRHNGHRLERDLANTIGIGNFDNELGHIDEETSLKFSNAFTKNILRFFERQTFLVETIKYTDTHTHTHT